MRKTLLLTSLSLALFTACQKEEITPDPSGNDSKGYLYKERDPGQPMVLTQGPASRAQTKATELTFKDYLGRSFRADYMPFESAQNLGYKVLDIQKIEQEHPNWVTTWSLKQSDARSFAYSTFDRYTSNSTMTQKVKSGFSLNLGIFKIGSQKTITNVFTSSQINESTMDFGQLDVTIRDAVYDMQCNTNQQKDMVLGYMDPDFKNDLYNLTTAELFKTYGPFVLRNFITGGKATALYRGTNTYNATEQSKENDINSSIDASFGFKDNGSGSSELGFGKKYGNGSSVSSRVTQFEMSIRTVGGSYGLTNYSIPKSIENTDINLNTWAQSLNNKDTHTIADIQDNGLVSLSEFVLEDNFKNRLLKYTAEGAPANESFVTPYITVYSYCVNNDSSFLIVVLHNRFGHDIILYCVRSVGGAIMSLINPTLQTYTQLYNLNVYHKILTPGETYPLGPIVNNATSYLPNNVGYGAAAVLEKSMKKFVDAQNNMIYLLYNENGIKHGFSIYTGKGGDYLLDTYGIRHWVNNLPSITIDRNELFDYKLVAL